MEIRGSIKTVDEFNKLIEEIIRKPLIHYLSEGFILGNLY